MAKKKSKKKTTNSLTTMTFYLPKTLHSRLKKHRERKGEMMSDVINRAIEKELKRAA